MVRVTIPFFLLLLGLGAAAQTPDSDGLQSRYAIWTADDETVSFEAMVDRLAAVDVVFLGEEHIDSIAHVLQRRLLDELHRRMVSEEVGAPDTLSDGTIVRRYLRRRPVVLAMEMFETDVQRVLDEYLSGLIREEDFLEASRSWENYTTDYRPLVEYARRRAIPVVASNAPGRYVNLVAREGEEALNALPPDARRWLPDRPLPDPSDAYAESFLSLMGEMEGHGSGDPEKMIAAQNLRDVTMAREIDRALSEHPDALVIHVNGAFHSNWRRGIPDHLDPETEFLVVTFVPSDDLEMSPDERVGDFIVLTQRMTRIRETESGREGERETGRAPND